MWKKWGKFRNNLGQRIWREEGVCVREREGERERERESERERERARERERDTHTHTYTHPHKQNRKIITHPYSMRYFQGYVMTYRTKPPQVYKHVSSFLLFWVTIIYSVRIIYTRWTLHT